MNDAHLKTLAKLEPTETDILVADVSDEALEAAAGMGPADAFTIAMCTGQSECPF